MLIIAQYLYGLLCAAYRSGSAKKSSGCQAPACGPGAKSGNLSQPVAQTCGAPVTERASEGVIRASTYEVVREGLLLFVAPQKRSCKGLLEV